MILVIRGIHAALWITATYKFGDWKNWAKYYPTVLFMGMGNLIYHLAFQKKVLWCFNPGGIAPIISELFVIFTIFFCTVIIFLTHFPKKLLKQIKYIILWVIIYLIIESLMLYIGMQFNNNGWNIWWSLLHNFYMFPLLAIHHKRPLLAWLLAIVALLIMMRVFDLPFVSN